MSILSKYILKKYLINFIIVLISLELFFVGIDYLQNFKNIPASANLQLLYILYNSFFTLTLALPLSIVFGWIVTLVLFIKNNEFVAFKSDAAYQPTFVERTENQDLASLQNIDYLILTTKDFAPQAERIATYYRTSKNYKVEVVDVRKVYNEFSSGGQDLTALRDFATKLNTPSGTLKYILIL